MNFAAQGLPERDAFVVHQYGVAATILGAALRLMTRRATSTRSGSSTRSTPTRTSPSDDAAAAELSDMAGFAPLTEILAAVHVKAHVRLFMN